MMKIPKPLQEVFDRFPLKTYPNAPSPEKIYPSQYFFGSKLESTSQSTTKNSFVLAVHNVSPINISGSSRYVPTDPVGLANSLIICHKNSLCLPNDSSTNTHHLLLPLSYLASPDNELPIVVEKDGKSQEVICSSDLRNSVAKKYFKDPVERLLNDLLDGFYDVWIFALIYDIPLTDSSACQRFFYQDPELVEFGSFITTKVLKDMTKWGSFIQRYPHLFHDNFAYLKDASDLLGGYNTNSRKCFEQAYFSKLVEFGSSIPLFMDYFRQAEPSEAKSILELKFASYFICIKFFVPKETHLAGTVFPKHNDAVDFSLEILSAY